MIGFYSAVNKKRMYQEISSRIENSFDSLVSLSKFSKRPYQLFLESEKSIYLIKVVTFNSKHELIITNRTYWCINENIKNWKRSSTPVLVPGVSEFLNSKVESIKEVIRVAVIYPGCYNRTRYLNESDVELVTFQNPVYGVYFVTFDEIQFFFSNQ